VRQCCPIMLPRWCVHCTGLTPVHAVASRRIVSWDLDVDQRAWVVTYNRKTFGESAKITSLTLMPPDTTSHIGGGDNLVMVSSLVVASVALPTLTWAPAAAVVQASVVGTKSHHVHILDLRSQTPWRTLSWSKHARASYSQYIIPKPSPTGTPTTGAALQQVARELTPA